jgi:hypothetical protein
MGALPCSPTLLAGPCPPKRPVLLWNVHLAGHSLPRALVTPADHSIAASPPCPTALRQAQGPKARAQVLSG